MAGERRLRVGRGGPRLLFVYGSLLSNEENHGLLDVGRGAQFAGEAETEAAFDLVDLGRYPALVFGGATAVAGELYWVTKRVITALDEFEGHPDLYRRDRIKLADGRFVEAYLFDTDRTRGYPRIASGRWRERAGGGAPPIAPPPVGA
jgi:gamma-glutamylaminecyclotransferase